MNDELPHYAQAIILVSALVAPAYATDSLQAYRLAQDSHPTIASARYALEGVYQKRYLSKNSANPS